MSPSSDDAVVAGRLAVQTHVRSEVSVNPRLHTLLSSSRRDLWFAIGRRGGFLRFHCRNVWSRSSDREILCREPLSGSRVSPDSLGSVPGSSIENQKGFQAVIIEASRAFH